MKLWRSMMTLPQPVKGCLVAYLIVFAAVFVSVPLLALIGREQAGRAVPWTMGALGISVVVLGLVLVFDVRGSAEAYAAMMKDFKPMGIDYSQSFFSKPLFIRFFGGMFALVGVWFIVGSTIFASQMS
jgi:Na+/melibiose symporter-like transporter